MSHLVEFPLASGGSVLVQVDPRESTGPLESEETSEPPVTRGRLLDRQDELPDHAAQTFDSALRAVQPAAESLLRTLTELSRVPDEIAVEFAVQLSAQAGAFIATLGSSAHFKISLAWHRPDATPESPTAAD